MKDSLPQRQFIKAVGLSVNEEGIIFSHDYGEKTFPWGSITHAFGAVLQKSNRYPSTLFIMLPEDSETFYYIDGSTYSPKYYILDKRLGDPFFDPKSQPYSHIRKNKEDEFKKFIKEICSHCPSVVMDNELFRYLRGSRIFLPTFSSLREIAVYCARIKDSASKREGTLFIDETGEDELKSLALLTKKREELKEGTLLDGRYVIEEVIRGGMGIVYIVFDPETIRFYAVKTFQEKYLWDERAVKQFIREAEIWTDLESHPNIVKAELVKVIEGKPYIFLEYITGIDLDGLMRSWFIPIKTTIEYAIQFCNGMSYAFRKLNLIHRDIKPSNCLITKDGFLKITDFGLGKIFDKSPQEGELIILPQPGKKGKRKGSATSSTLMMGTIPFMAPELFSDIKTASVKTDIYSFGILLYMMLTGKNPFFDDDMLQVIENHRTLISESPRNLNSDVPDRLGTLVLKCLAKDPGERYNDFSEIKSDLEDIYREAFGEEYLQPRREEIFSEEDWLNKGLSLASLSRHGEAILTFEQALRLNPQSLRARIYRGFSLLNVGKNLEALIGLDEGMAMDPKNWELWFYKGQSHWKLGEKYVALSCFDRALTLTAEQSKILGKKGKLLIEINKLNEGLACYDAALTQDPRAADTWYEKGILLLRLNRYDEALECLSTTLDINPRNEGGWYSQGRALSGMGYFNEAVGALKRSLMLNQESVEAWLLMGDCYRNAGKNEEALKAYMCVIEMQPGNIGAHMSAVNLLKEKSLHEEALGLVNRALDMSTGNTNLLIEKAGLLKQLGHLKESLELCTGILEKEPHNEEARLLGSSAKKWMLEKDSLFDHIFSTAPAAWSLSTNDLNGLLCVFCDLSDAINHLESGGDGSPRDNYLKAVLYFIVGEYNRAFQNIRNSIESEPDSRKYLRMRELIEERHESLLRKGVLFFKKSEQEERSAEESLILGMEKLRKKAYAEARKYLQEALRKDPSMHACRYYMAWSYELEAIRAQASYYYETFTESVEIPLGFWRQKLTSYHKEDPREIDRIFHRLIAHFPHNHTYWLAYLMYLSENRHFEKLWLLVLGLLENYLGKLDIPRDSALFWNVRGSLQLFLGRYRDAKISLTHSLEHEPESLTARLGLGKCLEGSGQFEEAEKYYKDLRAKTETSTIASYLLSELYMKQGLYTKPLNVIDNALHRHGDTSLLTKQKAYLLLKLRKYDEFSSYYERVYSQCSNSIPFKILRCLSLLENKKTEDVVFEISGMQLMNRHHMTVLKSLGFIYLQSQHFVKAMVALDEILEVNPVDFELYMGKGIIHYLMKDYRSAFESIQKAIELNPLDSASWQCMGAIYYHTGKAEESARCWEKAIRYGMRDSQPMANKATFHYLQSNYADSLDCIEKAIRLDPQNPRLWLLKAQGLLKTGARDHAAGAVEKVLSLSPQSFHGWVMRGILEFQQENYEVSCQCFDRAIGIDSRKGEAWYNRALGALRLKNKADARRALDRVLSISPGLAEAHIAMFIFDRHLGQNTQSDKCLERARELDPQRYEKWRALYEGMEDPARSLSPLEIPVEHFELPVIQPLSAIEPIVVLDYLFSQNLK